MSHATNLKRVSEDHKIDLYLRPLGISHYRLMDYRLLDRIVKDAYRYASPAVADWKAAQVNSGAWPSASTSGAASGNMGAASLAAAAGPQSDSDSSMPRSATLMCMPQLHKKQPGQPGSAASSAPGSSGSAAADRLPLGEQQRQQWWTMLKGKWY